MIYLEDDSPLKLEKLIQGNTNIVIKLRLPVNQHPQQYIRIRELYSESIWEDRFFGLGKAEQYGGLVNITTYFRLMLCVFRLDRGQARRAAVEALPFAVSEAWKSLKMCSGGCVARDRWGAPCLHSEQQKQRQHRQQPGKKLENINDCSQPASHENYIDRFEPFPSRQDTNRVLTLVPGCGGKHPQDQRSKQVGTPIHSREAVIAFLGLQAFESQRAEWAAAAFRSQFTPLLDPGAVTLFEEQIAHLVAVILALSLFEGVEELKVRLNPLAWREKEMVPSTVISAICRIFRKKVARCDVEEWHRVCRMLAGDDGFCKEKEVEDIEELQKEKCGKQDWDNTIISCSGGQVVWPAILFESGLPRDKESYSRLHWRRGSVYDQDDLRRYQRVVGFDSRVMPDNVPRNAFEIPSRLIMSKMTGRSQNNIIFIYEGGPWKILRCVFIMLENEVVGGIRFVF